MKDRISFELPRMIPPRDAGGAWELATDWRVICGAFVEVKAAPAPAARSTEKKTP